MEAPPIQRFEGVSIVASDIPGNRDLVVDGETGFLVNVGDRATLAQKALLILGDVELAKKLGLTGKERMLLPAAAR